MITETKFYKPRTLKPTKGELIFYAQGVLNPVYTSWCINVMPPNPKTIKTRRIALQYLNRPEDFSPDFFDMGAFQITYNFSKEIRNNLFNSKEASLILEEYGASGWSFRTLYEFLCENYNRGQPFIDTYFGQVFPSRPVYYRFLDLYNDIQDKINAERFDLFQAVPLKADGTPDMRYATSKRFADYAVWQDPIIKQGCRDIANEIRADIVWCLYSGRIPMSGRSSVVAKATEKRRAQLEGMRHPYRLFFASGQLIRHLNIFVEIAKGANRQGRAA